MNISNRIFPSWQEINSLTQPLTKGEIKLAKFLDNHLPYDNDFAFENRKDRGELMKYKGWLIFVQPYLNGTRPDIIIFNPYIGIQILEVKDYQLRYYRYHKDEKNEKFKFQVKNPRDQQFYTLECPTEQVSYYRKKIVELLDSRIGEKIDKNKKAFALTRTSVFFSREKYEKLKDFFSKNSKIGKEKNKDIVFGYDDLNKEKIKDIIPDIYGYKEENGIQKSKFWNQEYFKAIKENTKIDKEKKEIEKLNWNKNILFWLLPPNHSIEQGKKIKLTDKQEQIAQSSKGHFRIRGAAGSGKTLVLAYRAAKIASENKKILILSFNITLWHIIRDFIQRAPFNFSWKNFTFNHYHGFLKDLKESNSKIDEKIGQVWDDIEEKNYNLQNNEKISIQDLIKPKQLEKLSKIFNLDSKQNENDNNKTNENIENYCEELQNKLEENIELIKLNDHQYDAILIDEGQDYKYEWYQFLTKNFLKQTSDECVIVCDKNQNIYKRDLNWLDKRVDRNKKDLSKFGHWIDLTIIYRLPVNIHNFVLKFNKIFNIQQDVKPILAKDKDIIEGQRTLEEGYSGEVIAFNEENIEKCKKYLLQKYDSLTKEEMKSPSDIAILVFNHKQGQDIINFLREKRPEIDINHIFDDDNNNHYSNKKSFWMGDGRLKICTIHSFKGWEIDNVFILIPRDEFIKDELTYVAMTRAKKKLYILNQNDRYKEFIKELKGGLHY